MSDKHTRRDFLVRTGSLLTVGLFTPAWLSALASRDIALAASGAGNKSGHVLVVCQLSGGNDGVNTVVPFTSDAYYKARPSLSVAKADVLPISKDLGFNPNMAGLAGLYDKGWLAVVNGVGYPNPDRSHFRSMKIWHSANPAGQGKLGWVGKLLDAEYSTSEPNPLQGINLGNNAPAALLADAAAVPTFANLSGLQELAGDSGASKALRELQGGMAGAGLGQVQNATLTALDAVDALSGLMGDYTPQGDYANDAFGKGFRQIAQIVAVSPGTRVVYFSAGGFDTHSQQGDKHAGLLKGFSDAVAAFYRELDMLGLADKVTLMAFSEFGRRVSENGSQGTDHGQAGPMFVAGKAVKGGLYGAYPSLGDLDKGDLKFNTDFRQVYASVLDGWMGADANSVLGQNFKQLGMF